MADGLPPMKGVGARLEDPQALRQRREKVLERYQGFKEAARQRREKLEGARKFQQFRRDADELESWISEKLQLVRDDSFKDRTNLQVSCFLAVLRGASKVADKKGGGAGSSHGGAACATNRRIRALFTFRALMPIVFSNSLQAKILKHQAFEAEIAAHNNAILTLKSTGRGMLDTGHFAADNIKVNTT